MSSMLHWKHGSGLGTRLPFWCFRGAYKLVHLAFSWSLKRKPWQHYYMVWYCHPKTNLDLTRLDTVNGTPPPPPPPPPPSQSQVPNLQLDTCTYIMFEQWLAQGHNNKAQIGIEPLTLGLVAQNLNHYTKWYNLHIVFIDDLYPSVYYEHGYSQFCI